MKKDKAKTQVILFDGENVECHTVLGFNIGCSNMTYGQEPEMIFSGVFTNGDTVDGNVGMDKVELNNAQMKQIAKYNAERDVDFLIRKKQLIEEEIEMLKEKKKVMEKKFNQLIKFSNEFLKDNSETLENYIEENYNNDDDDYYD